MAKADKSAQVSAAVDAIRRGEYTSYSAAAKAFKCNHTAVSRRIRLLICSYQEADSLFRQCLTNNQEQVLIDRINYLSHRQMPPTSRIVRNLAKEIRGAPVGKNWTGQFIQQHKCYDCY
jgi:hypothetical protein